MSAIRILHLEDSPLDAALVAETLLAAGVDAEIVQVSGRESFVEALERASFELVLSDSKLPGFDGVTALRIVRERDALLPFIFVSGTMGEEAAVQTLTAGATDYVLKDRLARLPPCIYRALDEARERRQRAEAERALRASEERYRSFVETAHDWVWACDVDGALTFSNRAGERVTGRAIGDLVGRSWREFVVEEDVTSVEALFRRGVEDAPGPGQIMVRWEHADGSVRHLEIAAAPIVGDDGRRLGDRVTARDVTERLQLETQFRHAQKMEAIGTLAGGIAHDFNNLLTAVLGFSEMLLDDTAEDSPTRADLLAIRKAAEQGASLTRQLLAFSRRQMLKPSRLDLGGLVADLERMLRRVIGENVDVLVGRDQEVAPIMADRGQIEQLVMNLVVNARDAMPDGGRLTIETRNVWIDQDYLRQHPYAAAGPHVQLVVRDSGMGMDAATRARIFEPFFTTKERGKGTGLGLSTVYGIVKQSNGHIEVESTPGAGTTFRVYLPATADANGQETPLDAAAAGGGGGETLLLVEDEGALRQLLERVLARRGYVVLPAETAEQALEIVAAHQGPIHLLITDAVLPGMSGPALARRVETLRPQIRVLFVSGYTDDAIVRLGLLNASEALLQKPFGPAMLAQKVRALLDAPPSAPSPESPSPGPQSPTPGRPPAPPRGGYKKSA